MDRDNYNVQGTDDKRVDEPYGISDLSGLCG